MMAISFWSLCEAEVGIKLPELSSMAQIFAPFHVTDKRSNYNSIFGRDLLRELGISLDFQNNFVDWKESKISKNPINCKLKKIISSKTVKMLQIQLIELRKF